MIPFNEDNVSEQMCVEIAQQDDYEKTRNYWKCLKAKLKKENSEPVSATTQLKLLAPDGKRRLPQAS